MTSGDRRFVSEKWWVFVEQHLQVRALLSRGGDRQREEESVRVAVARARVIFTGRPSRYETRVYIRRGHVSKHVSCRFRRREINNARARGRSGAPPRRTNIFRTEERGVAEVVCDDIYFDFTHTHFQYRVIPKTIRLHIQCNFEKICSDLPPLLYLRPL